MYNEILNPKIWNGDGTLKPGVAEAIQNVVNQFVDDLNVPIDIVDVRIVGSNASYNYSEFSDLDVHIVINSESLIGDSNLLKVIYNSARGRFNSTYHIKIKGLDVEVSIEDISTNVCSNGVYSVTFSEWIKKPLPISYVDIDVTILNSYKRLTSEIEEILRNPTVSKIKKMIDKLYLIRKNSILTDGEYSKGNLIFKAIRNDGLLQKLKDEWNNAISKQLTFESMLENGDTLEALFELEE